MDVTDSTFQVEVIERSKEIPIVVDLWAPWCGPCQQLGPILEKVIGETAGAVRLAKVNVDENPGIAQAFRAQSIPAVHAVVDGQPTASFMGAQGEDFVRDFVRRLAPIEEASELDLLLAAGDETSLRKALEIDENDSRVIVSLVRLLLGQDEEASRDEILELLSGIPETPESRHLAALARAEPVDDIEGRLTELLETVKEDEEARQSYVDLLDLLGPQDERTAEWRRRLTSALY